MHVVAYQALDVSLDILDAFQVIQYILVSIYIEVKRDALARPLVVSGLGGVFSAGCLAHLINPSIQSYRPHLGIHLFVAKLNDAIQCHASKSGSLHAWLQRCLDHRFPGCDGLLRAACLDDGLDAPGVNASSGYADLIDFLLRKVDL